MAAAAAAGGPELSQLFGALINPANAAYARMGGFGKELIEAGLGYIVEDIQGFVNRATGGEKITPEDTDAFIETLTKSLPPLFSLGENAQKIVGVFAQLREETGKLAKQREQREELNKPTDASKLLTRASTSFESTFHQITGDFRNNFIQRHYGCHNACWG